MPMRCSFLRHAPLRVALRLLIPLICLSAVAGIVAPGCDRGGGSEAVTLRFWNGFTGPDGRTMLAMVQRFNRENPDIHVIMQRMEWGTYYNKLFVAGLGGRAPEVFVVHEYTLARFSGAKFVRPIDDLVAAGWIDPSDFDANVWHAVERNGHHWGLPLDIHLIGMYYNRALFKQAGLVDGDGNYTPPRTREEFLRALRRLRLDTNSDGRPDTWGFVFTWMRTNVYSIMRQFGGDLFSKDFSETTINSPQNIEALQFCVDLVQKEKLAPSPENFDAWIGFRQGRVGTVFEGIYMLPELKRQTDLDYGAAPLPQIGTQPAAWGSSHTLCMRADLAGKHLEAAQRFIKFLSDNSLDWVEGGQIPVRKSLRDSERFQHMYAQQQFSKQIPYAAYMPQAPFIFEALTEFDYAVEQALRGSKSPEQALDEAAGRVRQIMDRYRRSGRWSPAPAEPSAAAKPPATTAPVASGAAQ